MNTQARRASVEALAEKIYQDLRVFFQEKLPAEQMIRVEVQPVERLVDVDGQEVDGYLVLLFHTPAGPVVKGHFLMNYRGGNTFGVSIGLAEGDYKMFSISVPDPGMIGKNDGSYTHGLGMFVLSEIERITGEHFLREATEKVEG